MTRIIDGKVYLRLEYWLNAIEHIDVNCSRKEIMSYWEAVLFPIRYKILSSRVGARDLSNYFKICNHLYLNLGVTNSIYGKVELYYIRDSVVHKVADLDIGHNALEVAEEAILVGLTDMAMEIA